jgi:hypothetical protein
MLTRPYRPPGGMVRYYLVPGISDTRRNCADGPTKSIAQSLTDADLQNSSLYFWSSITEHGHCLDRCRASSLSGLAAHGPQVARRMNDLQPPAEPSHLVRLVGSSSSVGLSGSAEKHANPFY